jgi:hypothetical protein
MANPTSILFKDISTKQQPTWYEVKVLNRGVGDLILWEYNIMIHYVGGRERIIRNVSPEKLRLLYRFTVYVPGGNGMRMRRKVERASTPQAPKA